MQLRTRLLFLLCISSFFTARSFAQSIDYLRHNKTFYLCEYKRECSGCNDCDMQRFTVKIKNRADKKIKKVSYVYYLESHNRIATNTGLIIGGLIDPDDVGLIKMCLPNGLNWAISEIEYDDDSKVSFIVKDRLSNFRQEADECDCNKRTVLPNPNIK
jgi:hypothetical protein